MANVLQGKNAWAYGRITGATPSASTSASNDPQKKAKSDWQKAMENMSMMALAKGANAETMLGFALGKYLGKYLEGLGSSDKIADKITGGGSGSNGNNASSLFIPADNKNVLSFNNASDTSKTYTPVPEKLLGDFPDYENVGIVSEVAEVSPDEFTRIAAGNAEQYPFDYKPRWMGV